MYILGLLVFVQIVLESLPISSSTHVVLLSRILRSCGYAVPPLTESMLHLMHAPSIIVVCASLVWWYGPTARHWRSSENQRHVWWYCIMLSFSTLMTVVAYFLLIDSAMPQWGYQGGLMITGGLLLATLGQRLEHNPLKFWHAFVVGAFQSLAVLPGVSRLGATFAAGRFLGWSPKRALTYSLCLQLILMTGALFRSLPALWAEACVLCDVRLLFIVGCAMLCGSVLLRYVMQLVEERRIWWFGVYLMVIANVLWFV